MSRIAWVVTAIALGFLGNLAVIVLLALQASPNGIGEGATDVHTGFWDPLAREPWPCLVVISERVGSQFVTTYFAPDVDAPVGVAMRSVVPSWVPLTGPPAETLGLTSRFDRWEARGWPMLSAWCHAESIDVDAADRRTRMPAAGGVQVGAWASFGTRGRPTAKLVPFRPLVFGTVVNTIFYGAIIGMALFLLRQTRVARRALRGRCPGCGYDRGGDLRDQCPECGWSVRRRRGRVNPD